ncbi:hypothetical protein [Amorphus orientalis]|uniref:Septal ring factor EnvC (AmiA/AmiB activator) n=1 Tax=Amorphus orientalis TaxID=649198 RepID=A0AAE4AV67_9HYPH|nr:hypothetical protein [Amorphus orientalis]MDQ0316394.1 septal ring factor EnvC (AmiA/AmiB activator) [Amorphus orientalis]
MIGGDQDPSERRAAGVIRWERFITFALIAQTVAAIWYAAQLDAQVKQNAADIATLSERLDSSYSVSISREQLEDILGSRDAKLDSLETTVARIEQKIDRLTN